MRRHAMMLGDDAGSATSEALTSESAGDVAGLQARPLGDDHHFPSDAPSFVTDERRFMSDELRLAHAEPRFLCDEVRLLDADLYFPTDVPRFAVDDLECDR
jgi:hypothetical protein